MTRNEQILSEVQKRFSSNDTHLVSKISTFIDGAKWADKHPKSEMVNKDEFVAMDSYIGVEGLQDELMEGKSGKKYKFKVRAFIGEYM